MFDDDLMKAKMFAAGYARQRKFVYKAIWESKDVEHFIYFEIDSRGYLDGSFGLRNIVTDEFSVDSVVKHGHPNMVALRERRDSETDCSLVFPFGRIDRFSGKVWHRLSISTISSVALSDYVADFVRNYICPIVRPIVNIRDFFNFLVADVEPHPWTYSPAGRAAQIIALGSQLGFQREQLRQFLAPHEQKIRAALCLPDLDPKSFLDNYVQSVTNDWIARLN